MPDAPLSTAIVASAYVCTATRFLTGFVVSPEGGCWTCLIDVNCLPARLYKAAWLEASINVGAESLILNPGLFRTDYLWVVAHQSHNPLHSR